MGSIKRKLAGLDPASSAEKAVDMDATEDEGDVKLQRASADLLADLQRSLHPFLWQKLPSGAERIRRRVRIRERDRLVALVGISS